MVMKTLNVHISGSNDPIDFPFTGGVHHVIRFLYTEYPRNLKFFINLVFLEILGYICSPWSCKDIAQLKQIKIIQFKGLNELLLVENSWKILLRLQEL